VRTSCRIGRWCGHTRVAQGGRLFDRLLKRRLWVGINPCSTRNLYMYAILYLINCIYIYEMT
jgi:hypothetical protein